MSLAPAHSFACAFSTSSCLPTPLLAAVLSFFYRPFLLAIHQQHSPVKKKKKKEHNGNNKQKKKQKEDEEEKVLVIIIMAATSLSMAIVPSCSSASAVKASSSSQVTTAIPLSHWLLLLWLLFFYSSTSSPSGFSCFRIIPFVFCGMRVKMRVYVFIQPCKFCFGFREIVSVFVCLFQLSSCFLWSGPIVWSSGLQLPESWFWLLFLEGIVMLSRIVISSLVLFKPWMVHIVRSL